MAFTTLLNRRDEGVSAAADTQYRKIDCSEVKFCGELMQTHLGESEFCLAAQRSERTKKSDDERQSRKETAEKEKQSSEGKKKRTSQKKNIAQTKSHNHMAWPHFNRAREPAIMRTTIMVTARNIELHSRARAHPHTTIPRNRHTESMESAFAMTTAGAGAEKKSREAKGTNRRKENGGMTPQIYEQR